MIPFDTTGIDLIGQTAIVTGGGRGLGRAMALALTAAGAKVAVVARTEAELAETVNLIHMAGGQVLAIPADVSDRHAVEQIVETVERELGAVDLLVNNAAILGVLGPFWEADPDEWWRAMEINVYGALVCATTVMKGMVARKRGRIINVSSSGVLYPLAYGSAYGVSKTALIHLTEFMAAEGGEHGVVAFSICPGGVRTAMMNHLIESEEAQKWMPFIHQYSVDVGIYDEPEDSAALVTLLASGKADGLSGRFIQVSDNLDEMVRQTEQIEKEDLHTFRMRRLPMEAKADAEQG
jgi:NAD(P)-dependent dehydrogenase (short-subunit alcohol dehydrogenase family)